MISIDQKIESYIKHYVGERHAIRSRELERVFGLDGAEIRKSINRLRMSGVPICSDTNGYFYAEKQIEIDRTVQSFNSRIVKMQTARNGLVKSKENLRMTCNER